MSHGLDQLNSLSSGDVTAELLKCCGCSKWADAMAEARPFTDANDLVAKAERIWWSMDQDDWLEAFRAHPKIGEQKAAAAQSAQAQNWSRQEQSGVADAAAETKAELAIRNHDYVQRFGFIFIVCATGKTSAEMLAILNERFQNDTETELRIAAEEQRKITRLRIEKMLGD